MSKRVRTTGGGGGKRGGAKAVEFKSPAQFFADNKNIAGFDNPGKSLYTTIRELVENSLDAAESIGVLPDIDVCIEEMSQDALNELVGVKNAVKQNLDLYKKSPVKATKRAGKGAAKGTAKGVASGAGASGAGKGAGSGSDGKKKRKRTRDTMYYTVTVRDNGGGMPHDDIPNMLGRVLAGTNYGVRQTRGKFGLGAKMALIWSKMSTGLPIEVRSARADASFYSYCKLDIDVHANEPNVLLHEKMDNDDGWRGTEVRVTIEGSWSTYRARVLTYMRQLAVITPYAQFTLEFTSGSGGTPFSIEHARRSQSLPSPASEVKHHPSAVNQLVIQKLMRTSKCRTLWQFLAADFSNITRAHAKKLLVELNLEPATTLAALRADDNRRARVVAQLHQLFQKAKFKPPAGDCLSPAGEYNLRLGIMKELSPEMVATHEMPCRVFEGHPFIVEAGVAFGGTEMKPGVNVYRFANRIPLLFESGGDVATRTAKQKIKWSLYKLNQTTDRIGVFTSIVSTKIPFKGTGKEYIGDDIVEIAAAVKEAIRKCCLQLKAKLAKKHAHAAQENRKKELTRYIADVSRALHGVMHTIVEHDRAELHPTHDHMLTRVADGELEEDELAAQLRDHVDRIDASAAMEFVEKQGVGHSDRADVFLAPTPMDWADSVHTVHHPHCVMKLRMAPAAS